MGTWNISPKWNEEVLKSHHGTLPAGDNSSIGPINTNGME